MNIQPSVILWTVICFSLLMIILYKLLFCPVLKVLDQRKERLNRARQKQVEHAKLLEQQAQLREQQLAEQERQKREEIQAQLEQIQTEEKQLLKDAHRECLQRIDVYREQREKELEEILTAVSPQMAQVAHLFVHRIISDRD